MPCLAAHSLHRSLTPLGNYLRRMKAKLGPAAATTATAHKIATIFYTQVTKQVEYDESVWAQRETPSATNASKPSSSGRLKQRGYKLVPIEENSAA